MAHLLVVELPGGNDTDILAAACARGDEYSFVTADLAHYRRDPQVWAWVSRARHLLHLPGFDETALHAQVQALHRTAPFDAVLCLQDLRLVEAARLAHLLGLEHLHPDAAQRLRDKYQVRQRLSLAGVAQPAFALATRNEEVQAAVAHLGLPVLIKPADGYGSQNVIVLREPMDLEPWMSPLEHLLPSHQDYGLGVQANDRLLVERYMSGRVIGCDTFSLQGRHRLLGVNEKVFFERPSFAIRGGCFCPNQGQFPELESYVATLLDALDFHLGAAHIELMVTAQGYMPIEINPRLVGARIGRLISHALGCNVHEQLIALHLGQEPNFEGRQRFASTRWLSADREGTLQGIELPTSPPAGTLEYALLRQAGDAVRRPMENVDRIGYVMTAGDSAEAAETAAEDWLSACTLHYR